MKRKNVGLLAATFVASPVLAGIVYSALAAVHLAGPARSGLSTDSIRVVLADRVTWSGLGFTVWVAAASTLLACLLAMGLAFLFRGHNRLDRLARGLAIAPLPLPHAVAALCGVLILSQSGVLARMAAAVHLASSPQAMPALIYDRWGIGLILALTWKEVPFLALLAFSALATSGDLLEEAARSLGAGPLATFRRAIFPALWRGMLPGIVAVFTFVAGNYEAAALLAPSAPLAFPLLTIERYRDSALSVRADAYALVLIAAFISISVIALHEWIVAQTEALT